MAASAALAGCSARTGVFSDDVQLSHGWKIQSCAQVSCTGEQLSCSEPDIQDWYDAAVPTTVLGALTSDGLFEGALEGTGYYSAIDRDMFKDGWWFVKSFAAPLLEEGQRAILDFEGVSYRAEVSLNGKRLAAEDEMVGPFRQFSFDVTDYLGESNCLAVKVLRAEPGEFNIGFVDWNPRAADESMGIFRPVWLRYCNKVSLSDAFVSSSFENDDFGTALLKVEATLHNYSEERIDAEMVLNLEGKKSRVPVSLEAGEEKTVVLGPDQSSLLKVRNPRLWWCHNLGTPEMYHMDLQLETDGLCADSQGVDFGIRKIDTYMTDEGHRGFILNGKKVLVKGAGWTDDIFLRNPDERNEIELDYVKAMNLNTVRFENFWGTSQNLYDLCDRKGLLVLAGWSCFWEWLVYAGVPDDEYGCIREEDDMDLIAQSLRDQIVWLRNHPSIIAWYVGSDKLPRPQLEQRYLDILPEIDDRPVVMSAKGLVSSLSGPTGMKMVGPYDYQGPEYWYNPVAPGGAFGFNTETGIGAQMPEIESVKKMIPQDKLWPVGAEYDFHCTVAGEAMHSLDVLKDVIVKRYGEPENLEDFLLKAHHLDYDGTRAMFDAFRVNVPRSTGVIQWMLNSAWPSLYWQLYDWYLVPTASFWSVKKACAPVQLVYNYYGRGVYVVADELEEGKFKADIELYGPDGDLLLSEQKEIDVNGGQAGKVIDIPRQEDLSFLFLSLKDTKGNAVADNSYCLSAVDDVHDWRNYNWIRTELSQHSDYTRLTELQRVELEYNVSEKEGKTVLDITNNADKVAFFLRLALKDANGDIIVPVTWDDNYFSLRPGETRSLSCDSPAGRENVSIEITGWNVEKEVVGI